MDQDLQEWQESLWEVHLPCWEELPNLGYIWTR